MSAWMAAAAHAAATGRLTGPLRRRPRNKKGQYVHEHRFVRAYLLLRVCRCGRIRL